MLPAKTNQPAPLRATQPPRALCISIQLVLHLAGREGEGSPGPSLLADAKGLPVCQASSLPGCSPLQLSEIITWSHSHRGLCSMPSVSPTASFVSPQPVTMGSPLHSLPPSHHSHDPGRSPGHLLAFIGLGVGEAGHELRCFNYGEGKKETGRIALHFASFLPPATCQLMVDPGWLLLTVPA